MGEQKLLPEDHWLTLAEVRRRTALSHAAVYRHIKAGEFPPPLQLGPNFVRWRTSWIAEWEASRPRASYAPPKRRRRATP